MRANRANLIHCTDGLCDRLCGRLCDRVGSSFDFLWLHLVFLSIVINMLFRYIQLSRVSYILITVYTKQLLASLPLYPHVESIMRSAGRDNFLPSRKSGPNRASSCVTQMGGGVSGGRWIDTGALHAGRKCQVSRWKISLSQSCTVAHELSLLTV